MRAIWRWILWIVALLLVFVAQLCFRVYLTDAINYSGAIGTPSEGSIEYLSAEARRWLDGCLALNTLSMMPAFFAFRMQKNRPHIAAQIFVSVLFPLAANLLVGLLIGIIRMVLAR